MGLTAFDDLLSMTNPQTDFNGVIQFPSSQASNLLVIIVTELQHSQIFKQSVAACPFSNHTYILSSLSQDSEASMGSASTIQYHLEVVARC